MVKQDVRVDESMIFARQIGQDLVVAVSESPVFRVLYRYDLREFLFQPLQRPVTRSVVHDIHRQIDAFCV